MPDDLLEKRSGHTQSVSRALSLLLKLSEVPGGLNLSELARRVKLAPSTAHRLLTTLQLDQFVRFEDGRWLIGVRSFNVGSSYLRARDICYMARPYLRILMQETGQTSNLALMENDELVYMAQTECPELMRALARPGAKAPLTCSAVGKVCLAFLPRQKADRMILKAGISQLTQKSHITPSGLWRDLDETRKRQFAIDDEEHSNGLRCVSAPLFGPKAEVIGALSVSGPSARISEQHLVSFGQIVKRVTRDMTQALGGAWPE